MTRDTYLSVDLDYWNKASFDPWLLDALFTSGIPLTVTLDHHDMLAHVNAFPKLTRLENVDYHSDFIGTDEPLHIGNWVNHVAWRGVAHYEWVVPRMVDYHLRLGHHHTGANPFTDPLRITGWKSADKREGYDRNVLDRVAAAGVCVSPDYLDEGSDAHAAFARLMAWVRRAGVAVIPSRKAENQRKFEIRMSAWGNDSGATE